MTIEIKNLSFDAIIGILPAERIKPQKVIVHVELDYEYKNGVFINYVDLASLIKNSIIKNKFRLIEDALLSLHVEIKNQFSQISSIRLKISKPTILDYCDVSLSSYLKY
jgi:dihydroneopterin aldolase